MGGGAFGGTHPRRLQARAASSSLRGICMCCARVVMIFCCYTGVCGVVGKTHTRFSHLSQSNIRKKKKYKTKTSAYASVG